MKLKITKGSTVQVLTGSDKGKKGLVLEINKDSLKIKVQGVRMMTHFDNKEEGPKKSEGFIDYSNVKLVASAKAKKPSSNTASAKK